MAGSKYNIKIGVTGAQAAAANINKIREVAQRANKAGVGSTISAMTRHMENMVRMVPGGDLVADMLGRVGASAVAATGFVGGLFIAFGKTLKRAQELSDLAAKLDVTTQRLEALQFASKALGEEFSDLERVLADLRERQGQAIKGSKEMTASFESLGISMAQLKSLSPDELLLAISDSLRSGTVSAQEFDSVMRAMGEGGKLLAAFLQKDIAGLVSEFEESGNAMKSAYVSSFTGIADFWDVATARMTASGSGLFNKLKEGIFEVGDDFAKGVAIMTGQMGTLEQLQLDELLRKDPDYAEGQANIARMQGVLADRDADDGGPADVVTGSDNKTAELLRLAKELDRIKLSGLEGEEKRLALLEKAKRIEQEIAILKEEDGGDGSLAADIMRKQIELAKTEQGIDGLADSGPATTFRRDRVDAMAKIGGFIGNVPNIASSSRNPAQETNRQIIELKRVQLDGNRLLARVERHVSFLR